MQRPRATRKGVGRSRRVATLIAALAVLVPTMQLSVIKATGAQDLPPIAIAPNGGTLEGVAVTAGDTAHLTFDTAYAGQHFMLHWTSHFPVADGSTFTFPDGQHPTSGPNETAIHFDFTSPTPGPTEIIIAGAGDNGTVDLRLIADSAAVPITVDPPTAPASQDVVTLSTTYAGQNSAITFDNPTAGQRYMLYWTSHYSDGGLIHSSNTSAACYFWYFECGIGAAETSQFVEITAPNAGPVRFSFDPAGLETGSVEVSIRSVPADVSVPVTVDPPSVPAGQDVVTVTTVAPGQNGAVRFDNPTAGQRYMVYWTSHFPGGGQIFSSNTNAACYFWYFDCDFGPADSRQYTEFTATNFGPVTLSLQPNLGGTGSMDLYLRSVPDDVSKTLTPNGSVVALETTAPGQFSSATFDNPTPGQQYTLKWTSHYASGGEIRSSNTSAECYFWYFDCSFGPNDTPQSVAFTAPNAGPVTFSFQHSLLDVGSIDVRVVTPPAQLAISTTQFPNAELNANYSAPQSVTGGDGPFTWTKGGGLWPPGLDLDPLTGRVSGVPYKAGSYSFSETVRDSEVPPQTATKSFSITVSAPSLRIVTSELANGALNKAYSSTVSAIGGITPSHVWSAKGLPSGLTINTSTGKISGTPKKTGIYTFTVKLFSPSTPPQVVSKEFTIYVLFPPQPQPGYVALGDSYSAGEGLLKYVTTPLNTDSPGDRCHRSESQSYSEVTLKKVKQRAFYACSGGVIQDFYAQNHANPLEGPQLRWLGSATRDVTLTVGGNDVSGDGIAKVIMACLRARVIAASLATDVWGEPGKCQTTLTNGVRSIPDIGRRLEQLYRDVLNAAPNAQVRVLTYPDLFPTTFRGDEFGSCELARVTVPNVGDVEPYFDRSTEQSLLSIESLLNDAIASAVARVRATWAANAARLQVVNVDQRGGFNGHTISCGDSGRPTPWINAIHVSLTEAKNFAIGNGPFENLWVSSFHPNAAGQKAMGLAADQSFAQ